MSTEKTAPPKPISSVDVAWTEWSEAPRFALRYRHLSRAAMGDDYGDERYEMKAGDYVCFPAGQKVGHSFNKMEVRALRTKDSIFDMSGVRSYLDGEQTG